MNERARSKKLRGRGSSTEFGDWVRNEAEDSDETERVSCEFRELELDAYGAFCACTVVLGEQGT